ncbi:MAG: histidine kinase [Gemmatimonadetes bacterium]|nr:histidine kinase [Gemmatimonadota bacterium]
MMATTEPGVAGAGGTTGRTGVLGSSGRSSAARPFQRVSLFWKITLANLALVVVAALVGAGLTTALSRPAQGAFAAAGVVLGILVLVTSVVVNAALVKLALSPLGALQETARRVGEGQVDARAAESRLADSELQSLAQVFNEMLDTLSANRARQLELARRVLESEERERQRIAHELYSGTAQTLAGVLVRLRIAERHLTSGADGSMHEIREEVVSALEEIRGVARRLRPPELDELGVRAALEAHARSLNERNRIDVRFEGSVPDLSRESSLALFRIGQEAISNVVLHSGAETLKIRFSAEDDSVVAEFEDDGHGFDLGAALAHTGESLGLFGMHERAGYVQGELSLESGPGRGTRVRVVIPAHPRRRTASAAGMADRLVDGLVDTETELAVATVIDSGGNPSPY